MPKASPTSMSARNCPLGLRIRAVLLCMTLASLLGSVETAGAAPPNVVLILCDNLGYGDLGCYGSTLHRTPHIDRLATEGLRFSDCYAASGVCTASRAALLTGCYPRRVNMHVSDTGASVLRPVSSKGLNPDEITIAEVLKDRQYATAIFGKWHLGDQAEFLPTRQGFDYYFGIPYSDDMTPREGKPWPPLPLMENERVIEAPVDRNLLTKRYTEAAIAYMTEHRNGPFFIYLAHAMPGSTTAPFASEAFRGKSANGPWGDAVEEIDWSTGQILGAIKKLGIDENTLVIWTNDNGAPHLDPPQGSNAPLKGWGYDTSEGAMRVPLIARWPGRISAGRTCHELCTLMDLMPTLSRLAGAEGPKDRIIDGKDIWPLLAGEPDAKSPHESLNYYFMGQLQAIRSGRWKLYLPLEMPLGPLAKESAPRVSRLYDLIDDLGEAKNVAAENPAVVERLMNFANAARSDLGDGSQEGRNQRPAGSVPKPVPCVLR